MQRRRRGLTLIELTLAIGTVIMLGMVIVPPLARQLDRHRLVTAAQTLASDIAEARFEAARRGAALHVLPNPGPQWCWSVAAAPGCGCGQTSNCQLKSVRATDHPGVNLVDGRAVKLDAEGQADRSISATLQAGHEKLKVEVSPQGRARVCDPEGRFGRLARC